VQRLEALAQRMGEKALSTQAIVPLSPMSAHDRRIVHMTLADMDGVTTRSEGEGEDRRVLVVPVSAGDDRAAAD
jgi:spoIIIJ-associated protein